MDAACSHTGFFAVIGHGCSAPAIASAMHHGRQFFDSAAVYKDAHTVRNMSVGRGYEISPEHRPYEQLVQQRTADDSSMQRSISNHIEPSVRQGRMSERFLMGPEGVRSSSGCTSVEERELDEVCTRVVVLIATLNAQHAV